MGRGAVWQALYERLAGNACPICKLLHDRLCKNIEAILYEGVNDGELRNKLRATNGLCNFHAHLVMDMGDPLAHAILYLGLLKDACERFKTPDRKKRFRYQSHEDCMFCVQNKESEQAYVETWIDACHDDAFLNQYKREGMLCLPHLEMIRATCKDEKAVRTTFDITLDKYEALCKDLSSIQRKHDYRFADEPWTDREKTAWKDAVDTLNGWRGIRK